MIPASVLGSSDEKTNGFKLMRLIVDGGTAALKQTFTRCCPGNLQANLCSPTNHAILCKLKGRIIKDDQWYKLYPAPPYLPNIDDFDITLLSILLRNICGLSPPRLGWDIMPDDSDESFEADVVRIRLFRNQCFGHIPNTSVSIAEFKNYWEKISPPLERLGIDQGEIDRLENELCGEEEVQRVFREWKKSESEMMNVLNDVLNKHLVWCDFKTEIDLHYKKFVEGTREWVFDSFRNWFMDETSSNRVFVISGLAGMGKSVIAAVICKKFADHVGSSHFFQYNNSRYNNPTNFLQSLAWWLCKVIPEYKEALIRKLSGNLGQSLNNMDVEALFSLLLKEPLSGISCSGKRVLIVLDAIDECEYNGRYDVADLISNHLHKLPSFFRFVITTRPEKNLIDKFKELNPFVIIESKDERNVNDVRLVLEKKISTAYTPSAELIDSLAEKSDGLMLYAYFLSEIYKDKSFVCNIYNLPGGVEKYFEMCLQRLENELSVGTEIFKDDFFSFLNVLAVAKESLPEAFIESLFDFNNSPTKRQKMRKGIIALSSLLEIKDDKSISFSHKSIRDWLINNSEHDYSVDVRHGHESLFGECIKKLDQLKQKRSFDIANTNVAVIYSLKYWMTHLLNGLKNPDKADYFVSNYVADIEVMFACVCVDVDHTLNNIINLKKDELYSYVSENTRATVETLFSLIRKFAFLLRDYPQTFLQNVVNEGGEELSLKASTLLATRYKDIFYLEFKKKDRKIDALKARCPVSGIISGIDISPKHDYVVCSYKGGGIELFSLATCKSEWKIHDFKVEVPSFPLLPNYIGAPFMLPHCIVFHPSGNLILPGRLDKALTLQGKFKTSPFQAHEDCSQFTNCCFSFDNSRMVTLYGNKLIVWNIFVGQKEKCLACKTLFSFSYTRNSKFLGTVDIFNVFNVYDIANDYKVRSVSLKSYDPVEIISTFEENCWLFSFNGVVAVGNPEDASFRFYGHSKTDIVLPSNFYCSCELEYFLQHPDQSWFLKVRKSLNCTFSWSKLTALRYILIRNESVLIYSCTSYAMHVFSIEGLASAGERESNMKGVFSNISRTGDFAYFNNLWTQMFTICELDSNKKYSKPREHSDQMDFAVSIAGVILYGKNDALELWNSNVTERLAVFDELAGLKHYLQVSDELLACVYQSWVTFFNVVTKEIERKVIFDEDIRSVHACNINYDVLAKTDSCEFSLWKDGTKVDGWEDVFRKSTSLRHILWADFSPGGSRLALCSAEINSVFVFDVVLLRFLAQVPIYGPRDDILWLQFYDNKTLLCSSMNHILYLINAERGEILTCLDVGDIPAPVCVCRKRSIVFVGLDCSEHFELIKVWLPR